VTEHFNRKPGGKLRQLIVLFIG